MKTRSEIGGEHLHPLPIPTITCSFKETKDKKVERRRMKKIIINKYSNI